MAKTQKLKFDPLEVRPSFRSTFCRELVLPSGEKSGFLAYPITTEEIRALVADFTTADYESSAVHDICKTESEYAMWLALRLKYGIVYLQPQRGWRLINDNKYEEPAPADIFDKIYEICHGTETRLFDEINSRIIQLEEEQKDKKFFDDDLTSPATML